MNTIIILLILAGIAISQLTNSGLFNNTQLAKQEYANAQEREDDILKQYENAITTGEVASGRDTVTLTSEQYRSILDRLTALEGNSSSQISNNYSTTEQVVGTWTDGKTIYQRTYDVGAFPNATKKTVDTGISNSLIDNFIEIKGWCRHTDKTYFRPIPYVYTGSVSSNSWQYSNAIWMQKGTTNWEINIVTGVDRTMESGYVTLQYTKTTDAVPTN